MLRYFFRPVDSASFTYFRFFAGIFLSWELILRLLRGDFAEYIAPFHFTYLYFDWVRPWSPTGMVLHFIVTILSGLLVAVGFWQRTSAVVLFLGYVSLFLMEKSAYINHFYLYCLISFWLIFFPVKYDRGRAWLYYVLLFHISLVYIFAGIANLDPDWLSGLSVKMIIPGTLRYVPWSGKFITYATLSFNLIIVPALIFRKTRVWAFVACSAFHILNKLMFGLATFPWFCIMASALFFGTSWPRKLSWFDHFFADFKPRLLPKRKTERFIFAGIVLYCLIQTFIPFRHWFYSGKTDWTEEGHMFSWRMKLRTKSGEVEYYIQSDNEKSLKVVHPQDFLTAKQYRNLVGRPDFILEFAHFLKKKYNVRSVYASSRVSLNGRDKIEMIIPHVDLSSQKRSISAYRWINPFPELTARDLSLNHRKSDQAHNLSSSLP